MVLCRVPIATPRMRCRYAVLNRRYIRGRGPWGPERRWRLKHHDLPGHAYYRTLLYFCSDRPGNMRLAPRSGNETTAAEALVCMYDAWNRLAAVYKDADSDQAVVVHRPSYGMCTVDLAVAERREAG